jgi:hypothetical protein
LGQSFARIPDHRQLKPPISLRDALLSAFAMFSLKDPSLLAFDQRRNDANLKALFGIGQIPSDTQTREILDPLDPEHLRPTFGDVFRQLQRGKALEPFEFYNGCYLLSLDGTGYFSSQQIHCPSCQVKEHKNGTVTYEHQMLAAVLVHPDFKEVIPLAPEPIQKQDGSTKNDCERNAARRLLQKIRREHPRLKLIVVEDGLASNGPHVRDLIEYGMHFLLGVKPGDHAFLKPWATLAATACSEQRFSACQRLARADFLRAAVVRRQPKAHACPLTLICKLTTFPDLTFLPATPP